MMWRLWLLVGGLLVIWMILIAGARALARQTPLPPTYLDTGSCDQPCWGGFQPGGFTVAGVNSLGRDDGPGPYYMTRIGNYGGRTVMNFEISTAGRLSLADVVNEFGAPERIECPGVGLSPGSPPIITTRLYFFDGLVVAYALGPDDLPRVSPDMHVHSVTYYAPGEPAYRIGNSVPWLGFAAAQRYCSS